MYNSLNFAENQCTIPLYDNFLDASINSPNAKSKKQWNRKLRKVIPGSLPVARVKNQPPMFDVNLYPESATVPYQPSALSLARWRYSDLFVKLQGKQNIIWNPKKPDGPGWSACNWLTDSDVANHINGKKIFGVRAKAKDATTNFFVIDLDCHEGASKQIFMQMLRALLDEFWGKNASHIEVADNRGQGVHLRQVFAEPVPLDVLTEHIKQKLHRLELLHPLLTQQAIDDGFKPFSKTEFYPSDAKGIRLPLCQGRTVLLDRPLPKIYNKRCNRDVHDVMSYVNWLDDNNRSYMSIDDVMSYVDAHVTPITKIKSKVTPITIKDSPVTKHKGKVTNVTNAIEPVEKVHCHNKEVFELADRQSYLSLERIASIGLVPLNQLRINGSLPDKGSALATICVQFAMVLWHDELFHLPTERRFQQIEFLLQDWVLRKHNNVSMRLATGDDIDDVKRQITNCVKTAANSTDHNAFFEQVRENKRNNMYKRNIELARLLIQSEGTEKRGEREGLFIAYPIECNDSSLPLDILDVLCSVKPKTRPKPFLQFATRLINHLQANEGTASLSQAQGYQFLGYENPTRFTKYKEKLIEADLIQLAQESVAHQRACVYSLTKKARELLGMTVNVSKKIHKRIKYSDEDVIAALETL